jgi:alkanesulfonate monooxygenase SsuD/methylene tetrahydromethanopterin reductase-like flavin-dependent oxidoreductase (luciferase family)
VLARFGCSAATRDEAVALARPYFETFAQHARAAGWGAEQVRRAAQDVDALVEHSLVGSHAEVAAKIGRLGSELGVASIALIPPSAQFDTHKHILADFVDEVRPLLE